MSEYNLSDSILDTPVTWGELENHLRTSLNTNARFGAGRSIVDIGDGTGVTSRCALITFDWVDAEEVEKLPKSVVLKVASILPMQRINESLPKEARMFDSEEAWASLAANFSEVHNTEIDTYNFFAHFDHLSVPKMFYGIPFDKESKNNGQICMEFVENSTMMNFTEAAPLKQLKQIARALGKVQACSIIKEAISPQFSKDLLGDFAKALPSDVYCGAFKLLSNFDPSSRMAKAIKEIGKLLPDYEGSNLITTIHKQMNYRPVLVNGDCRTENILIEKDTGDLLAIIDWQFTHHGVGVEDLLRIQMYSQSAKERRETTDEIIEEMYNSMIESLDGTAAPYTLAQLKELYALLFPHAGLFFAATGPTLMKANLMRPGLSEEERAKIFDVQLDKLLGLLEDIAAYDALNKQSPHKITFRTKD